MELSHTDENQSLSQPLKSNMHALCITRACQVAGSVVCENYVDIAAGSSTRNSAATGKSCFPWIRRHNNDPVNCSQFPHTVFDTYTLGPV